MQVDTIVNKCRYSNKCIYSNALLTELLLDSAKPVGALKRKRKPAFEPRNDWFDDDYQIRRRIYRRKLREANKTSNPAKGKQRLRTISCFCCKRKNKCESDTNQLLHLKKLDNPKEYWSSFKRLSRELDNIPIAKSKLRSLQVPEQCS